MIDTNAPVGLTCPDIDKLIGQLDDQVKALRNILKENKDLDKDVAWCIDHCADMIEETYYKRGWGTGMGLIEQLRSDNHRLREWGEDLYKELETLKPIQND